MSKNCPHCGATLHENASFCPYCAHSINQRRELVPPKPLSGRVLRAGLFLLAAALAGLLLFLNLRPQSLEGQGEVFYTDEDGTYQLLLGWPQNRTAPVPSITQQTEVDGEYRFPSRLYINMADSGADAGKMFLRKTRKVTAEFIQPPDTSSPITCTEPAPEPEYAPDAALVSFIDFTGHSKTSELVWTLEMDNGDTIRLLQTIVIDPIETYNYYSEDVPMDTTEDLQALVDKIQQEIRPDDVANIHLPPVTYQGNLVIEYRSINFYGSEENGQRTTFEGTIRMDVDSDKYISYIQGIDFRGSGDGIAISTAARARVENCSFTNWKTGVLGYGNAWVNVIGCQFENNQVGFHFNSTGQSASHSMYNGNLFANNGTAVILENVPTDLTLNFENSRFVGNGADIDNQCNQALNITRAIFE